jgi:ribosomal protein S13
LARIAGVVLPNKRIVIALTYIYGIGKSKAQKILEEAQISQDIRADQLQDDELARIREVIDKEIQRPNGMMVITGPTGSGKTTTLYGALNAIKDVKDKIITANNLFCASLLKWVGCFICSSLF